MINYTDWLITGADIYHFARIHKNKYFQKIPIVEL